MSKEEKPMLTQLQQFRNEIYEWFSHRADALMDVLDALSSTTTARSVVELSLNPLFRREYSSVHDGIENLFVSRDRTRWDEERQQWEQQLVQVIVPYVPRPQRPFWLLGTDVTSASRPFAVTLSDRMYVYQPNPVKGNKPVTIGHQYSLLAVLPEKARPDEPPWIVPLLVNRVTSTETKRAAGLTQITRLLEDETLPFHHEWCVQVVDSDYSAVTYLGRVAEHANLVTIARLAGHRTVYRAAPEPPANAPRPRGHPTWFGAPMKLKDPTTWDPPDETAYTYLTTRKGQTYLVHLEGWQNMLLRGTRAIPMHHFPFTLLRARVLDMQGTMVFPRPMWLVVLGERRQELTGEESWESYRQRYDLEHFLRFGKQRLLMDAYRTPDTAHEENWWTLSQVAYLQLWVARDQATLQPRPWERYLPTTKRVSEEGTSSPTPSPSAVQRDMARIIREIGTPAKAPKQRGKSPGRAPGQSPGHRDRLPVIKKGRKKSSKSFSRTQAVPRSP
jgi:hypothetical protein